MKLSMLKAQDDPYVGLLLKEHLEHYPQSKVTKRRNAFVSFCDNFATLKVSQVTATKLQNWLQELKRKNDYTDRNMNHIKSNLNHFFKYLVTEAYCSKNPLDNVKFNRQYSPRKARVILSHNEMLSVLEAMKAHSPDTVYPFIYCLAHTGARREEVRLLKWEHIDFETGYITFRNTKNGRDRSIRMGASLSAFLRSLPRISEWVFMSQFGWLLSRSQIDETIEILQRKHPTMKRWRCHDLRHTFAFNFLKRGGDMYALKAILGHRSIELTIDLYGHFTAEHVQNVSPYD